MTRRLTLVLAAWLWATVPVSAQVGVVPAPLPTPTDDRVAVANGSRWEAKAIPLCTGASDVLQYDTATNSFACVTLSSGGAPTDATYITQTANGSLSAEQALADLSTGLLKVTTGTGVLSTAAGGTDYARVNTAADVPNLESLSGTLDVASGGTGAAPGADDQVLIADSTTGATWRTLPDCDLDTQVLHYDAATNAFSCGDDDTSAGGGAPTGAKYWVAEAHADLTDEVNLGAAGSGLLVNTVTAGVGTPSVYGGTICTNQFIRILSGTGAATCNDVEAADFGSQTANRFLAAPNGSAGDPTFRAIVAADVPTLNQNTTGTAANVTGTVAIANGGTGQTGATAAFDALAPTTTQGDLIYHNGTDNVRLAKGTASQVLTMNAGATAPEWATPAGGSDPWTKLKKTDADQTTTANTTTLISITSLTFTMTASTDYLLDCTILYSGNTLTNGIGLTIDLSSTVTLISVGVEIEGIAADAAAAEWEGMITADVDPVLGSGVAVINTTYVAYMKGIIRNDSGGGDTATVQFRNEVAVASNTVTVKTGSTCLYRTL